MTHVAPGNDNTVAKLNLKLQCSSQVYVIIEMHIYLWVEL